MDFMSEGTIQPFPSLTLLAVIGRRNNVTRRLDPSNGPRTIDGAFSSSYKNRDCNFPSGRARASSDCALPRERTNRG